jgi:prepilin-type N-terminal cleavage/methylation domain-containing protein
MRNRPGITLIEVLVAIFIMSIGLLALLTLFPLGALRMSQALQNDRAASCASAGANIYDAFGIRTDGQYDALPTGTLPVGTPSPFVTPPTAGFQYAAQNGTGIPIFIDPNGVNSGAGSSLGASTNPTPATPGIWRLSPSAAVMPALIPEPGPTTAPLAARYFTLLDDMTFYTNGQPDTSSGVIPRGDRYTWAYLLHRSPPSSSTGVVDLQIVVYAGRSTALPSVETTYAATNPTFVGPAPTQQTQVILTHPAGQPPTIRRGSWILDTSYDDQTTITPTFSVHGDFYRVISISTIDNMHVNLELQDPISKPSGMSAVTVMDNVVEVFKRGVGYANAWEFRTQN